MKRLIFVLLIVLGTAHAQLTPGAMYSYSGSSWIAAASTGSFGASSFVPSTQIQMYCYNSTLGQWVYADSSCFGGGSGTFTALTGDATSTSTGGATTVVGLNGTLLSGLATGFLFNTTSTGVPSSVGFSGTGNVVRVTSATLVTPALGTPASGVITNLTGTCSACTANAVAVGGITGLGTGVATALATNTGSTGAPVLFNGAGGTPTSLTATNVTGLPTTRTVSFQFGSPGGSAISTGTLGYVRWPYTCTGLGSWSITVDAGTATIKTWKIATGTAIPTSSNSISTSGVAISTGTNVTSSTVTDFTTTATTAGDIMAANLGAVSGVGYVNFELAYTGCSQ